jgi:L-alanine-DL-glutamate epimerase-like enolase superfamily enzyme
VLTSPSVERIDVHAFTVPTDGPDGVESDGTFEWDCTTLVLVEAHAAGVAGLGYTYADVSVAHLIASVLAPTVVGRDAMRPSAAWTPMFARLRNAGQSGAGAMAVSAVDVALWDLRARLVDVPLAATLPAFHSAVPIYGSGGFTNYPLDRLESQLGTWVAAGIPRVKLKTSRAPAADPMRLTAARAAVGPDVEIYVDANGALGRKEALHWADRFAGEWDVRWFEEPVSSDDVDGLRLVRERSPLEVAAGEYVSRPRDFRRLLGAVDCLQADVTRCGGITGVLQAGALAAAYDLDLSAHCAPALSTQAFLGVAKLRHLEYFHDHVRLENLLFDGVPQPRGGELAPDPGRPGLGLEMKWRDAERYRVYPS